MGLLSDQQPHEREPQTSTKQQNIRMPSSYSLLALDEHVNHDVWIRTELERHFAAAVHQQRIFWRDATDSRLFWTPTPQQNRFFGSIAWWNQTHWSFSGWTAKLSGFHGYTCWDSVKAAIRNPETWQPNSESALWPVMTGSPQWMLGASPKLSFPSRPRTQQPKAILLVFLRQRTSSWPLFLQTNENSESRNFPVILDQSVTAMLRGSEAAGGGGGDDTLPVRNRLEIHVTLNVSPAEGENPLIPVLHMNTAGWVSLLTWCWSLTLNIY